MCNKMYPKFNCLKQQAYITAFYSSSQLGGSALAELTHVSGVSSADPGWDLSQVQEVAKHKPI